ncbi:hypothetical protein HDU96_003538 [Phlyctochytrium bullatum]|nr:hypothetical protein HDU96_003538 [Phlyctochytrium bullatum]
MASSSTAVAVSTLSPSPPSPSPSPTPTSTQPTIYRWHNTTEEADDAFLHLHAFSLPSTGRSTFFPHIRFGAVNRVFAAALLPPPPPCPSALLTRAAAATAFDTPDWPPTTCGTPSRDEALRACFVVKGCAVVLDRNATARWAEVEPATRFHVLAEWDITGWPGDVVQVENFYAQYILTERAFIDPIPPSSLIPIATPTPTLTFLPTPTLATTPMVLPAIYGGLAPVNLAAHHFSPTDDDVPAFGLGGSTVAIGVVAALNLVAGLLVLVVFVDRYVGPRRLARTMDEEEEELNRLAAAMREEEWELPAYEPRRDDGEGSTVMGSEVGDGSVPGWWGLGVKPEAKEGKVEGVMYI